ncbi:Brix domain [Trypanosoma vivax]|uniref:Putative ribosome biogenesis protein n=1 Tax=Trypanosoma vivax (strain Y486) TaxID=1055687 RepID=G0U4K3_TRYVY|nr:Brix domain [Trypanosoma vivax]CCC52367.1 putative ribosome biogenesis protein [Trypanosoma vivax Y486]
MVKRVKRQREEVCDAVEEPQTSVKPSEETESMIGKVQLQRATTDKRMTNRQKCLVLSSRSVSSKDRHLLLDLRGLMPHAREHAKLGRSSSFGDSLVELCALHQCNSSLFIEAHRRDISYLWISQMPQGPSVKMQLTNVHTADELRMAGNCLKFSRPLLHFDRDFETRPHLRVVKSLLQMAFNTPRYHPKSKPFIDHIICFFFLDEHIWFRNYQIIDSEPLALMEIGPRFTLEPTAIFNGCLKGNVIWKSDLSRTPTEQRRDRKTRQLEKMIANEINRTKSNTHKALNPGPEDDPLDSVFRD